MWHLPLEFAHEVFHSGTSRCNTASAVLCGGDPPVSVLLSIHPLSSSISPCLSGALRRFGAVVHPRLSISTATRKPM